MSESFNPENLEDAMKLNQAEGLEAIEAKRLRDLIEKYGGDGEAEVEVTSVPPQEGGIVDPFDELERSQRIVKKPKSNTQED